jgi:ATP/ADP translocase
MVNIQPRKIVIKAKGGSGKPSQRRDHNSKKEEKGYPLPIDLKDEDDADDDEYEDTNEDHGLLTRRRKRAASIRYSYNPSSRLDWQRPYWLGLGLFLILFPFWLLDSLKDPIFAKLVDGNLDKHQPPAKLASVVMTLALVCLLEYLSNKRQQRRHLDLKSQARLNEEILDPGGQWTRMSMDKSEEADHHALDDTVSISIFTVIFVPYIALFSLMAYLLLQYDNAGTIPKGFDVWYVFAYILYALIESFGSLAVASFWSFTNSTLSLDDAERYYGPIVAIAQLGAIGGSTMVATNRWSSPTLIVVACLVMFLQLLVMREYDRRFKPSSMLAAHDDDDDKTPDLTRIKTWQDDDVTLTKPFWSGIYLIVRHNYVLLILGVSSLFEVSLTCLDYQMKLLGLARFEENNDDHTEGMSFSQFMGRYGQVVNVTSFLFSSLLFPWLIKRVGLRITLRVFPTLLFVATAVAYGALPGNLTVLFLSMSVLKGMTYSIHDPSTQILYIPTSNAIKFRAKFWIDVVGARISKAVGSGINTYAGSVDRMRVGTIPSLLTAAGLWLVCYYAGIEFDRLLATGEIVGLEQNNKEPETYMNVETAAAAATAAETGESSSVLEIEVSLESASREESFEQGSNMTGEEEKEVEMTTLLQK